MASLWGFMKVTFRSRTFSASRAETYHFTSKDPDVWPEAETFKPERFLETCENGLKFKKQEQFVPFGIGRRICMGETLARDSLFIFTTTLVKNLKFENPNNFPKPNPENFTDGFTVIPHPYHVNIRKR